MPILGSSRLKVLEQKISENVFPLKVSSVHLFYVKKYFQLHKCNFFFFRLQNTRTFPVLASAGFRKIKDHSLGKKIQTYNLH